MSSEPRQYVRRVILPSGRSIEIVWFDGDPEPYEPPPVTPAGMLNPIRKRSPLNIGDLHICGTCGSSLVYPTKWEEAGQTHWEVTLRCPGCEWTGTGIFEQELVERFDEELDRGTEALVRDLERLVDASLNEIYALVSDMEGDHTPPED
jgi:hypothetical protein